MNVVVLVGRLTRDPELKFGQSGKAYSRFSLAVDRPFSKGEADFINCVAFGKTAELIGEYLRKGRKVGVNGRLQMNRFEMNGEKRTSYDVLVEAIEFLESKGSGDSMGGYEPEYSSPTPKSSAKEVEEIPYEDDDELNKEIKKAYRVVLDLDGYFYFNNQEKKWDNQENIIREISILNDYLFILFKDHVTEEFLKKFIKK